MREMLWYGKLPVPYAVSWSAEENPVFLDQCPHARRLAICQHDKRGQGKPIFGKPHMNRQREVIALDLCDLCAKPLKNRTKISLSHARSQPHGAAFMDVLQFEPLLHRECAAISIEHCPSLKRDIANGTLFVRQVMQHAVQFALFSEQGTFETTGERKIAVCHAKVQLIKWKDRDMAWMRKHSERS